MSNFIINGGFKLKGSITTNGAKNSAVALLAAAPILEGRTVLYNVPDIEEVKRIIEILESIGIKISRRAPRTLEIQNNGRLDLDNINRESFEKTRSALLFIGSLLSRFDAFSLPKTSGCHLGKRSVNPHSIAFSHLGVKVSETAAAYQINGKRITAADFTMYESGDTATENALMAALLARGETRIRFASSNYMVQDLAYFLKKAGARISGIGTAELMINGPCRLKGVDYSVMPDPIESMAFIACAIATGSELTIKGCPLDFLRLELEKLRVMGQKFKISPVYRSESGNFALADITIMPSRLHSLPDKIYGRPFPGLNIDNLPFFIPILAKARGSTLVHDWVYENRAIYYIELNRLGANILLHDPHRVTVTGPTIFKPTELVCPPALRPSLNLLICMLAAKGRSILRNSYSIDRGYEKICDRLNTIGARIERFD